MRYLRIVVVLIFICSCGIYAGAKWQYNKNYDFTYPVIISEIDELELSVNSTNDELLMGLRAEDEKDGDLTDSIIVAEKSFFQKNEATCRVKYVVFDSNHNSATLTRNVHYKDYTSPKFTLEDPLVYTVGDNIRYLDYIKAQDVLDGDISEKIKVVSSNISNYKGGNFPVVLEVSNSYGDKQSVQVMVQVNEKKSVPEIRLKTYMIYLEPGSEFDPYELIVKAETAEGARLDKKDVVITGNVDTEKEGCYQLTYSIEHEGIQGVVYLAVVVREETLRAKGGQ